MYTFVMMSHRMRLLTAASHLQFCRFRRAVIKNAIAVPRVWAVTAEGESYEQHKESEASVACFGARYAYGYARYTRIC